MAEALVVRRGDVVVLWINPVEGSRHPVAFDGRIGTMFVGDRLVNVSGCHVETRRTDLGVEHHVSIRDHARPR